LCLKRFICLGQRKPVTGSFAGNVKTRIRVDDDDEKPVERKQHLDPERMDKSTLKMELTKMKVVLPTKDSPRKVYVDLFKKSMNNKLTTDLQKKTDALEKDKSHAQKQTEQLQQEVKSLQKQLASEGDNYRNRLMQADKEIIAASDS
jgi:chaperonin cofactor prefoldin